MPEMAPGYPEPLVISPLDVHQYTFILLHGQGSSAVKFGPTLLSSPISGLPGSTCPECTLASTFPHAKFVFPTASRRRATVYKRSIINQWFDSWTLSTDTAPPATALERQMRESLQIDGLRETATYLHELLRREVSLLGGNSKRVFLGGLSQGCAASLVALLLWDGGPLGAAIGMCGWLPFQRQMDLVARGVDDIEEGAHVGDEDFNPFEDSADSSDNNDISKSPRPPPVQAVAFLMEELEISLPSTLPCTLPFQDTRLFIGHGVEDQKIPVCLGREAASFLDTMGMEVTWKEYEGLGHWYSENLLSDLVGFLKQNSLLAD
ncbi:hypothetical protein McanMca71_007820 [Microsporum canis]